jgi:hypothetical protein
MKTWDCEKPRSINARKVVTPPLMMAGPILVKLLTALSSLVPIYVSAEVRKINIIMTFV